MSRFNLSKVMGLVLAATMAAVPASSLATPTSAATLPSGDETALTAVDGTATAALSDVIAKDADGNALMYTTLRDADLKVVATNDPNQKVDAKYKPTSDGGKGGTVDKGATLYVNFRMAEIAEHDGQNGIQEGTVYAMDLPAELVPAAKSRDGQALIDPETPVTFFNAGGVKATGGIYTKKTSAGDAAKDDAGNTRYELHVIFSDVENRVDISGEYQFSTTLSDAVKGGSTVTLTYVPGGKLGFDVTPDPAPAPNANYTATVSGAEVGDAGGVYSITSELTKTIATPSEETTAGTDAFDYGTFTVKSDNNQGVWIDWSKVSDDSAPTVFNNYGKGGATTFRVTLRYEDGATAVLEADANNVVDAVDGKKAVRFTDATKNVQVDVFFDGVLEGSQSSATSFIATSYTVSVTDGNGAAAKGLRNIALSVPTILTGDYTGSGKAEYGVSLEATADAATSLDALNVTGKVAVDLGSFGDPYLRSDADSDKSSLSNSLEYLPSSVATQFSTGTSGYNGNYYWAEFDPSVENNLGVDYYVSLASFLPGGTLASYSTNSVTLDNGKTSTFMNTDDAEGFALWGPDPQDSWTNAGSLSVNELLTKGLSDIAAFKDSAGDAKLQYQLRKVFATANPGQQLVVYRSESKNSDGTYAYIVIDPRTVSSAIEQNTNGWHNFREDGKEKAGSWRLHVFNGPNTVLDALFPQYLGTVDANDDVDHGNSITDKVQVGNGAYDASSAKSKTAQYGAGKLQAAYMDYEWVSDGTIFWKMTVNVANWQKWSDAYLYIDADGSLIPCSAPYGATVSGAQVTGGTSGANMYVKQADGSWKSLTAIYGNKTFATAAADEMTSNPTLGKNGSFTGHYAQLPQNSGTEVYCSSDNTITIGFFASVYSSPASDAKTHQVTAQLVCHTGDATLIAGADGKSWPTDYGTYNSDGQWAYRATATGNAATPALEKTGASTSEPIPIERSIETLWTLRASNLTGASDVTDARAIRYVGNELLHADGSSSSSSYYIAYGGISGRISVGDTMRGDSKITTSYGEKIEGVDPAKYTHITQMFVETYPGITEAGGAGGGCGPVPVKNGSSVSGDTYHWQKYDNGRWVSMSSVNTCWDPYNPGIYRSVLSTTNANSDADPLAVYVYYAGNMSDSVGVALSSQALTSVGAVLSNGNFYTNSLVVEYRGLHQAKRLASNEFKTIDYKTQTDVESLNEAANKATGKTSEIDALTQLYNVTLGNSARFGTWCSTYENPTKREITTAITAALSINKSTPGVTRSENTGGLTGSYTLQAQVGFSLTEYVNFEDYLTGFDNTELDDGAEDVSYKENEGDGDKALKALAKAINIKNLTIKATDTSGRQTDVYSNGSFTSDWQYSTLKLNVGSHAGALFSGQFRHNGWSVPAGTLFTFTYDLELNMDGADGFRASEYYAGGALKLYNGAMAERPYSTTSTTSVDGADEAAVNLASGEIVEVGDQNMQFVDDGISLAGGEIDPDERMLRVWPDGDVEATYLAKDVLDKSALKTDSDNGIVTTGWMFWDWTGTQGKGSVSRTFNDVLTQTVDISLLDERVGLTDEQKQGYLTELNELRIKYTSVQNLKVYLSDSRPSGKTAPSDKDLIWRYDGVVDADREENTGKHNFTLTYKEPEVYSSFDLKTNDILGPGFALTVSDLGYNKYLTCTYDMVFDYESFCKDGVEKGLLNPDWTLIGTTRTYEWAYAENTVKNDRGQEASATSGKIQIGGATVSKKASNVKPADGTADWTVDAATGNVGSSKSLTITDEFKATSDNDTVAEAATAATSIDGVKVTYASVLIWENGALTSAATSAGWTNDNISVSTDGTKLAVTINNTDALKPVASNKAVKVTYSTKLDKKAYAAKLLAAGVNVDEGAYALANSAAVTIGSLRTSASDTVDFTPEVPLVAEKTSYGHPGNDLATTSFVATGEAGDADRAAFTMTDSMEVANDDIKGDAQLPVYAALKVTYFNVAVRKADGSGASFNADDIRNGDTGEYKVTLTDSDGEDFDSETTGVTGWVLTFDKLPAGATVTVSYDVTLDRETYLEEGGEEGKVISLKNSLSVGAQNSKDRTAESAGEVSVQKQIAKTGALAADKAENGNPIINWTFDVYLESSFSADDLANLQSVAVRDKLNPALKAITGKVKVYDLEVEDGALKQGKELAASDYDVAVGDGNVLTVTIKNPAAHHNVRIVAPTEVAATLGSVTNAAELVVDGEVIDKDEVDEDGADAVTQWGKIVSVATPTFTATAEKYIDGQKAAADVEGDFTFSLVECDEDGNVSDGAHVYTASNDEDGNITFETIAYQSKPREGTHCYLIYESAATGDYSTDKTAYLVQVTVTKNQADGNYLVQSVVKAPATATSVRFNNSTKRDLSVTKAWNDDDNAKFARPASVTVRLYQDGSAVEGVDAAVLSEDNGWSYMWRGLPIAGGDYSVVEDEVADYTSEAGEVTLGDDDVWHVVLTNTYAPATRDLTVTKAWGDNDSTDKRPDHVVVRLYKDGKAVEGGSAVLNAANNWAFTWNGLDRDGAYTVTEDAVDGYESSVGDVVLGEDGVWRVTVTNTLKEEEQPEVHDLIVTKTWDDNNDAAGNRPESVTVRLYQNGKAVEGAEPVELTAANGWSYTWKDLPAAGGEYSVVENEVEGYVSNVGKIRLGDDGVWRISLVNTAEAEKPETRSLVVTKAWNDMGNLDGARPKSITVRLYKDGKAVEGAAAELSEDNNWTYTWTDLVVDGSQYTVVEDAVAGYDSKVSTTELGSDGVWRVTVTNTPTSETDGKKDHETPETPTTPKTNTSTSTGGKKAKKYATPSTGDTAISSVPFAVAGVVLVALGCAACAYLRKRK